VIPAGRGVRPAPATVDRGRGPAGRLRPARSTQQQAGLRLGPSRASQAKRLRPSYREAAHWTWPARDRTRRWSGTPSAPRRYSPWAKGLDDYRAWQIRSDGWKSALLSAVPAPSPLVRHYFSNALGGILLRAGRLDEAIVRINEGIAAAKDVEIPNDWTYLALAHARSGNLAEATENA